MEGKEYKILLCEDDQNLGMVLKNYLELNDYDVTLERDGRLGLAAFQRENHNICLLDVMMPNMDGFTLAEEIRDIDPEVPLFFLSAKTMKDDIIQGYKLGADDYITKPFHLPELHARLRAIYRRNRLAGSNMVSFNEITLNTDTLEATVNDIVLDITRKEFELLLYLVVNKNRVLSRQSIAAHLWGDYTDNLANFDFVYQHIKNLRKKISAANGADYIATVYGLGYKFNATSA